LEEGEEMTTLSIYLNDHLAGAIAGTELAKRAAKNNIETDFAEFLSQLRDEIDSDRRSLEQIMEALQIKRNFPKDAAAWLSEKVGRLKLNGQIAGYSNLSRLVELEGLALGINGKQCLWKTLKELSGDDDRIDSAEVDRLIERALSQAITLEEERTRAIRQTFPHRQAPEGVGAS
jgi:hypothetical protein